MTTKSRIYPRKRQATFFNAHRKSSMYVWMSVAQTAARDFEAQRFPLVCRWWFQGQVSTRFSTITPFGTQDARRGDQLAHRATNRILSRLAALPRYVCSPKFDLTLSHLLLLSLFSRCNFMLTLVPSKVEQFWRFYSHMIRPGDLTGHSDFHLFKEGIKPMWEVSVRLAK